MSNTLADASDAVLAARRGMIDITVDPAPADILAALRADPRHSYESFLTVLARLGAGAVLVLLTALFCWFTDPEADKLVLLSTALAGGVVGIAAFRFGVEHQWKRRLSRIVSARRDPYRVIGDGRSLSVEDEHTFLRMNLEGLRQVVETPRHLVVFHRHAPVLALPRTAFPRPEIATALADFLRSRTDQANGQTPETRHE